MCEQTFLQTTSCCFLFLVQHLRAGLASPLAEKSALGCSGLRMQVWNLGACPIAAPHLFDSIETISQNTCLLLKYHISHGIIQPQAVAQIRRAVDGTTTVGNPAGFSSALRRNFCSGNLLSGKCLPIVMERVYRKRFVWTNFLLSVSTGKKTKLEMCQTFPTQQFQNNSLKFPYLNLPSEITTRMEKFNLGNAKLIKF